MSAITMKNIDEKSNVMAFCRVTIESISDSSSFARLVADN
jgi:hypothetical protein